MAKQAVIDYEFLEFLLAKNYSVREISQIIGVKEVNLYPRLSSRGLTPNKRDFHMITPFQAEILIIKYKQGLSSGDLSKEFGIAGATVLNLLKKNNIEIRESSDKIYYSPNFNHNAFEDMSDEKTAYFYGLLLADGCITKSRSSTVLSCGFKREDEYMLQNILDYLGSSCSIYRHDSKDKRTGNIYKGSFIRVGDKRLISKLMNLGFDFNKSKREKLPPEDCRSRHFWRGMVDGDGNIRENAKSLSLCGSLEVIEGFSRFVKDEIGVEKNGSVLNYDGLYRISFYGENSVIILKHLYSDSKIHLNRKYESYLAQLNM